jgi:hypothetical protein
VFSRPSIATLHPTSAAKIGLSHLQSKLEPAAEDIKEQVLGQF